ncbi:flagellar hook-associated protein FlgK [Vibrio porteresiae]|uniref:Flagellar hook-associated protein 1 n=1 Tax=Vibrio porteresiae DSM 19223 TaxID=1123496 RepID=A0ABZ0QH12_9VIBR|nr:flagellar hook-associated protein FlgK [Vibrio porteresiae]WPC74810.1 flagellar hook-associated protein FlgK [Vibrio porteresiae DSM 19223]
MASDLLNVGRQSVLTAQRQLNTTGHNISNVNTEGYSRQSVIQGTNMPRQFGGQTYGMGVHVENVRRSWDQFAVKELNLATTDYSNKKEHEENLDMLSKLLSSVASKKIPENLNEWFDAVKTSSDTPNDVGARKVVLEKANIIAQNLNDFHETVRREYENTNEGLNVGIKRVNQLAIEIRDLQRLMMRTPGPHNDLMDRHEKLVKELSQYTKVTVTPRKNAEGFNIHIGNGHTLVSGTEASQLKMIDGYPDVKQLRLAMVEGDGVKAITSSDIGGQLGALFEMRDKNIPNLLDEIGRMSTAFSYQVNKLQHQGLDLNGDVGQDLFTDVNADRIAKARVVTSSKSQADMAVYIDNVADLKGGEYSLQYDGSEYHVTKPGGEQETMVQSGGNLYVRDRLGNLKMLDGMRIQVNNDPATGERVILRPTRAGAADIKVQFDDPSKLAAQSYEASTTFAQGKAKFTINAAGTLREFQVVINDLGNEFSIRDKNGKVLLDQQKYPPSGPVSFQGTEFELSAGALPKDKFTANLVPSEGDNGNLRKMIDIQNAKNMDDNESTLVDVYHNLNTNFGLKLSTASRLTDVARLEKQSAEDRIASVSGVNLDEEAANMMKFQQAYMASSRIIQAANDTFNTILQLR